MGEIEPSRMRVSDADRNRVAEILREAAGDGRIDFTELDERLEATYAAKTHGDLVPITHDLAPVAPTRPPALPGGRHERAVAIMSGVDRRGAWAVPEHFTVLCVMGGAELDLREAQFPAGEVTLTINAFWGGANVVVNRSTRVVMEGTGIMGGYTGPESDADLQLTADSPVVRVRGVAIMGGVSVVRRPMPGEDTTPGWRRRH
jgi:hypothetical protein